MKGRESILCIRKFVEVWKTVWLFRFFGRVHAHAFSFTLLMSSFFWIHVSRSDEGSRYCYYPVSIISILLFSCRGMRFGPSQMVPHWATRCSRLAPKDVFPTCGDRSSPFGVRHVYWYRYPWGLLNSLPTYLEYIRFLLHPLFHMLLFYLGLHRMQLNPNSYLLISLFWSSGWSEVCLLALKISSTSTT